MLLERECCVCEIVQAMRISQTRSSRALTSLHNVGLLKTRRDGLWVLYSMDEEAVGRYCDGLPQIVRGALKGNELAELDRQRLRTAVRKSPCAEVFRSLAAEKNI